MWSKSDIQFKDTKPFGILELRQQEKNIPFKRAFVKHVEKICKTMQAFYN